MFARRLILALGVLTAPAIARADLVAIVELRAGWPKVLGEGEVDIIALRKVVESRKGLFRRCYEQRMLRTGPQLAGKLLMEWRLDASGGPSAPRALSSQSTLNDAEVTSCIERTILDTKWPRPKAPVRVQEAFLFHTSDVPRTQRREQATIEDPPIQLSPEALAALASPQVPATSPRAPTTPAVPVAPPPARAAAEPPTIPEPQPLELADQRPLVVLVVEAPCTDGPPTGSFSAALGAELSKTIAVLALPLSAKSITRMNDDDLWSAAKQSGAGYAVLGSAKCVNGGPIMDTQMHSFRAFVALRVIDVESKRLVGSSLRDVSVGHMDGDAGGQRAFVELAKRVAMDWLARPAR